MTAPLHPLPGGEGLFCGDFVPAPLLHGDTSQHSYLFSIKTALFPQGGLGYVFD